MGVSTPPVGDDAPGFAVAAVVRDSAASVTGDCDGFPIGGIEDVVADTIGRDADGLARRDYLGNGGNLRGGERVGGFDLATKDGGTDET